jgi:hypothetical protein
MSYASTPPVTVHSEIQESGEFRTTDLALATALLHEDCGFLAIDRTGHRAEFIFEESRKLQEAIAQYWSNNLMCSAQSLLATHKRAKHILYDSP